MKKQKKNILHLKRFFFFIIIIKIKKKKKKLYFIFFSQMSSINLITHNRYLRILLNPNSIRYRSKLYFPNLLTPKCSFIQINDCICICFLKNVLSAFFFVQLSINLFNFLLFIFNIINMHYFIKIIMRKKFFENF